MAELPSDRFSLKDISKWPLAFAVVIFLWIAREFMARSFATDDDRIAILEKKAASDEVLSKKKDSVIAYWQTKYIMEVDKNLSYFKQRDSAGREALEKPAKALLNAVKQNHNDSN